MEDCLPPLPPCDGHDRLSDLPPVITTQVLQGVPGHHTCAVCRTFRALYPRPMLKLKPYGPLTATPAALQAALSTFPPTITSLNLRAISLPVDPQHVDPDLHPVNAATLTAIPTAFPNLRRLLLPPMPPALAPAALAVLQACPHLTSFHTCLCGRHTPDPNPPHLWAPLILPPISTRVKSLTVPNSAVPLFLGAPAGTFRRLTNCFVTLAPDHGDTYATTMAMRRVMPNIQNILFSYGTVDVAGDDSDGVHD